MATAKPKYYITTPIYYVNARPHLGIPIRVASDCHCALKQMRGFETLFLPARMAGGRAHDARKVERSAKIKRVADDSWTAFPASTRVWKELGLRWTVH